jgi:glycosyltransferase involved in cell wall biosynthesis
MFSGDSAGSVADIWKTQKRSNSGNVVKPPPLQLWRRRSRELHNRSKKMSWLQKEGRYSTHAPNYVIPERPIAQRQVQVKVAICLQYGIDFPGGVSVPCRVLIEGLSRDYEIVLVSTDTREKAFASSVGSDIKEHVQWNPERVNTHTARDLAEELEKRGVQIAHFHFGGNFEWSVNKSGRSPILFVAQNGIVVLTTVHMVVGPFTGHCAPDKPLWFKWLSWPAAWAAKMQVLKHVRCEVVTSARATRWQRASYWPFRNRFRTIYQSRIKESELNLQVGGRDNVVLYAGHIATRKGQHILAAAFAQIAKKFPAWRLELLGEEVEPGSEARLRDIVRQNGIEPQTRIPGPHPDVPKLMRKAAIFVQPSFFEGLPLALQEAMLCQCACIATDIPGNNELITDERSGLLVPKGDVARLAAALDRLMSDHGLRLELGKHARKSVLERGMTADRMLARYSELYGSLV